jgi:hypothetical protein
MLEIVTEPEAATEARTRVAKALDGPADVADSWLASLPGVALIEESARSPDEDQATRLVHALDRFGERDLMAVATEDLAGTDEVYRLAATGSDLGDFAYARSGLNYALMPTSGLGWLVVCTVHDYMLVSGPRSFVTAYAGDPAAIASDFRAFIEGDPEWSAPENSRLLRHLRWIEES